MREVKDCVVRGHCLWFPHAHVCALEHTACAWEICSEAGPLVRANNTSVLMVAAVGSFGSVVPEAGAILDPGLSSSALDVVVHDLHDRLVGLAAAVGVGVGTGSVAHLPASDVCAVVVGVEMVVAHGAPFAVMEGHEPARVAASFDLERPVVSSSLVADVDLDLAAVVGAATEVLAAAALGTGAAAGVETDTDGGVAVVLLVHDETEADRPPAGVVASLEALTIAVVLASSAGDPVLPGAERDARVDVVSGDEVLEGR